MNIGENIKFLRERKGLTLEEVGEYIGVNKATVQRYETGKIDIKRTVAVKLAEILGTTPADILGFQGENFALNDIEQKIIESYRETPEMQGAIHKILGIEADKIYKK